MKCGRLINKILSEYVTVVFETNTVRTEKLHVASVMRKGTFGHMQNV